MVKTALIAGVDSFTKLELLEKAAIYKGLKLCEGGERANSEPIKEYALDDKLLTVLAEQGIKQQPRPDCHNEIFTLVDKNPQENVPGWAPSNYWNFKLLEGDGRKFNLRIFLGVGFGINIKKRGVVLCPRANGTFLSPADRVPNFRMFKALVESDEDAPIVAKELAESNGSIVVTWTDLGLGGIRRLSDLFIEFAGNNEMIKKISKNLEVFDPVPNPQYQQPGDELFVAEPAQPGVFKTWQAQLEEYRLSLRLVA